MWSIFKSTKTILISSQMNSKHASYITNELQTHKLYPKIFSILNYMNYSSGKLFHIESINFYLQIMGVLTLSFIENTYLFNN